MTRLFAFSKRPRSFLVFLASLEFYFAALLCKFGCDFVKVRKLLGYLRLANALTVFSFSSSRLNLLRRIVENGGTSRAPSPTGKRSDFLKKAVQKNFLGGNEKAFPFLKVLPPLSYNPRFRINCMKFSFYRKFSLLTFFFKGMKFSLV